MTLQAFSSTQRAEDSSATQAERVPGHFIELTCYGKQRGQANGDRMLRTNCPYDGRFKKPKN